MATAPAPLDILSMGFSVPDPFAPRQSPRGTFVNAVLATALFRCWHILIFFSAWGTLITILNHQGHELYFTATLLTVVGTVLGFVISYRTTSSFERYNEGRRLWSQIILASRTFARTVWFHIPDPPATESASAEELKARAMVEKKTVINLLEAYAVAIKHYLRGEDGIYYNFFPPMRFLQAYPLIRTRSRWMKGHSLAPTDSPVQPTANGNRQSLDRPSGGNLLHHRTSVSSASAPAGLPLPATSPISKKPVFLEHWRSPEPKGRHADPHKDKMILNKADEAYLLPASMPPKYHLFDLFPFSLFIQLLTKRGKEIKGKKAARIRAKMRDRGQISLYLSSYISALQKRKTMDVPTTNTLLAALNQLVDSLTGLERILTTPIPFSYSIHLWVVTILYNLCLPFQIWQPLGWITIPACSILSFIFFGFLVAGEEIENPFGYDKNDLNMDHFTSNIIRNELRAITSAAAPDPARWAFAPENDLLFATNYDKDERVSPEEWARRGSTQMQAAASFI
ncbi:Bestrophin, RFP-TM, chloride channel-domain-containing protein [Desarmillaria tabescens]|uniref:Bestrophin, RFP-TM, chloride channel-domain-containing protein n=1 Tax=Armillaria tabescens TaxID=1929756 RepID=A0AA39JWX8_ARMTA|nr:Bestrophin, RFP-TM, chloride channel-domain-containing protein [Desarmillaria tabescens]KAK0450293.1 Bestrophin, RFP-TM, chloride channel-domain-containing protein [Desarmillaria tabescens]